MSDPVEVFLSHHGIRGMKWGVRKEESGASRRQAHRENKAQKFDAHAAMLQTKISELNSKKARTYIGRNRIQKKTAELSKKKQIAEANADAKRQGHLTSTEKKVLVGASATAALLVAYGAYSMTQSGQAHSLTLRGKAFLSGERGASPWKTKTELSRKDLSPDELMSKVVRHVNPGYGEPGTKVNCRRCTFAYEMRRRGFDVSATRTRTGAGQARSGIYNATKLKPGEKLLPAGKIRGVFRVTREDLKVSRGKLDKSRMAEALDTFEGGSAHKIQTSDSRLFASSIMRSLAHQPEGARGELGVKWHAGGAHSMAWEVIKGKPVIFDTQTGKKFENDLDFLKYIKGNVREAGFTRLDNIPLNHEFLQRWLKDA